MCYLNCNCGKRTKSATCIDFKFMTNRTSCYVLCEECKDKLTEEELDYKLKLSTYKTGLTLNNIPVPLTFLLDKKEFKIPRSNCSVSMANISIFEYKNRVRYSDTLNGYAIYVVWSDPNDINN